MMRCFQVPWLLGFITVTLSGCGHLNGYHNNFGDLPRTPGEISTGYGYIPLDGLSVLQDLTNQTCAAWAIKSTQDRNPNSPFSFSYSFKDKLAGQDPYKPLLESLPDVTVRFAVGVFDASGSLTFGPAKVTVKDTNYRAVLDYVNIDVIPVTMLITPLLNGEPSIAMSKALNKIADPDDPDRKSISFSARTYDALKDSDFSSRSNPERQGDFVTIPVYVGLGMRLTADIRALEPGIALTSLGALGVEAQAKRLSGTLTVQTIGITGEGINTALPLPSTLDQTTIENGILAIGGIRAVVYKSKSDGAVISNPRIVGMYSPIGSAPALINAIYAELSKNPPKWPRQCKPIPN